MWQYYTKDNVVVCDVRKSIFTKVCAFAKLGSLGIK